MPQKLAKITVVFRVNKEPNAVWEGPYRAFVQGGILFVQKMYSNRYPNVYSNLMAAYAQGTWWSFSTEEVQQ